jgi:hypothetical protein
MAVADAGVDISRPLPKKQKGTKNQKKTTRFFLLPLSWA